MRRPALHSAYFLGLALRPVTGSAEQFGALVKEDFEYYGKMVKTLNLNSVEDERGMLIPEAPTGARRIRTLSPVADRSINPFSAPSRRRGHG